MNQNETKLRVAVDRYSRYILYIYNQRITNGSTAALWCAYECAQSMRKHAIELSYTRNTSRSNYLRRQIFIGVNYSRCVWRDIFDAYALEPSKKSYPHTKRATKILRLAQRLIDRVDAAASYRGK